MSKTTRSASRSRSRSRSRSPTRSRSRSRSRSRKRRYSSRSRSRSRSPHGQGRNPPREYQNNRGFRGFHRGFRRPYYFRGRGRGFFPRGRYQRGGGGGGGCGYNNNYRPNGWQNYRQHPQQNQNQHQQYYPHSPRRGRSRSPKKRSGSPRSHSHSDRSSSPRSRHRSPSSSSSSSRSSSPRRKSAGGAGRLNARDVREEEREVPKEGQKGGGGGGGEEAAPLTGGAGGAEEAEEAEEGASANGNAKANKAVGRWQGLTDYSTSPRREGSLFPSATPGQAPQAQAPPAQAPPAQAPQASPPLHSSGDAGNGGPSSRSPLFSGFGFFSREDSLADKEAISSAFKKFLEEHNNKKKLQSALENGREKGPNGVEAEPGKGAGKPPEASVPRALRAAGEAQRERRYEREASEASEAGVSLSSFLKDSPFLCENEEREERAPKPRPKQPRQDARPNEDAGPRGRATPSARQLFEERFGQWEELAYAPAARDDDLEAEGHTGRKREAAIAAALAQRKQAAMFSGCPSPEKVSRARRKERAVSSPSPSPSPPPRRNSDREKFLLRGVGDSPPRASGKKGEFCVRMDGLRDGIASSSKALLGERRACRDLGLLSEQEGFSASLRHAHRSPTELYAQHIVTIVHRIRAQHFSSSEMTLNERFAMYQRRAEEKEMEKEMEMDKPRKSPEIHRRIDVSPSAFKKQSHLSERMRNSEDGSYKNHGRATRSDSNDLRLDIERRKKHPTQEHPTQEQDCKRGGRGRREEGNSPDSGKEQLAEKSSRHRKKSKKCKKKHSRSSSSSSSSDSEVEAGVGFPQEEAPPREEGFNRARLGPRDAGGPVERGRPRGGVQLRIRGRGWNRGNYQGNHQGNHQGNYQGNHQGNHQGNGGVPSNVPPHPNNEDWDPEYTPKSRKYYLHDDRDEEGNRRWFDTRGRGRGYFPRARGRFLVRKVPPGSSSNGSPRWSHDKFLGTREGGQEEGGQDHKEGGQEGVMDTSEQ